MGELAQPGKHRVAVAALVRLRADTVFRVTELEKQTEAARADLIHIDAVIRMFAPHLNTDDLPARQRQPRRLEYFAHGEISRRILDALRPGGTIQAVDVAKVALLDKGMSIEYLIQKAIPDRLLGQTRDPIPSRDYSKIVYSLLQGVAP